MGFADYETSGVLRGNKNELAEMKAVLMKYTGRDQEVWFTNCIFADCPTKLGEGTNANSEVIEISFEADGPYGRYDTLKDIPVFREMADVAPVSFFEIKISGNTDFTEDDLTFQLSGGLLRIETDTLNISDQDEAYLDYLSKKIPYEWFLRLFKVDADTLSKNSYRDLLSDLAIACGQDLSPLDMDYDEFMDQAKNYIDDVKPNEEEFEAAKEEKLKDGIQNAFDFMEENDLSERESFVYNPVTGKWME